MQITCPYPGLIKILFNLKRIATLNDISMFLWQPWDSPWTTLALSIYGRQHENERHKVYNAWRGHPRGSSVLRQRVLTIIGLDEYGNSTATQPTVFSPGMHLPDLRRSFITILEWKCTVLRPLEKYNTSLLCDWLIVRLNSSWPEIWRYCICKAAQK